VIVYKHNVNVLLEFKTFLVIISSIMRSAVKCFRNYLIRVSLNDNTQSMFISRTFPPLPSVDVSSVLWFA
jgi:hypothetical protein